MAEKNFVKVGGQLQNIIGDGILAYSNEIKDEARGKTQEQINTETYEKVAEVNEALSGLSPEQGEALALSERVGQLEKEVGYYECSTSDNVSTKQVVADGYALSSGCSIKVKMANKNTAASNVTLKIGSSEAKPLYYAGILASAANTWDAGEVLDIYYNPNNGGAYYANNVEGGSADGVFDVSDYNKSGDPLAPTEYIDLAAALGTNGANVPATYRSGGMSVKFINSDTHKYEQWRYMDKDVATAATFVNVSNWQGVDETPTAWSQNLVTSGGVINAVKDNSSLYTCDTAAATQEKTVSVPGYILGSVGALRIKFTNENTFSQKGSEAKSSTLNISSTGAKKLLYNGLPAALGNSWEANGVVELYYDADADNGSGAYYAYPISEKGCISLSKIAIRFDNIPHLIVSEVLGKYIYLQNTNKLMFVCAGINSGTTNLVEVPLYIGMRFFYQGHDYYYDGTTIVRVDDSDEMSLENYFQDRIQLSSNGTYSYSEPSSATPKIKINHANSVVNFVAKGAIIIGYESLDSATGVLLSDLENPSWSIIYTLSKRIPANIKYVAFGYPTETGLISCSITRDNSLDNFTYDMDTKWPLESGYYTLATAIAAVPEVYRGLHKTLLYRINAFKTQEIAFIGTDVSKWTDVGFWNFVGENDNNVRGITAETDFRINPTVTNEDLTRDQYLEFVCTTKNRVTSGQVYFACSKVFNMRYNAAVLQVFFRDKISIISSSIAPSVADKDNYHHFLLVKSQKDVSGTITHWLDVYIDGINVVHVDVTDSISSTISVDSRTYFFCPYWNFLVLRAGYYSGNSDGVDAFALEHFNSGNPVAYRDNVNELIYEFLPENMHTDYLLNSANKTRSILDASTQPITLLYSNPYDDVLRGTGVPESIAPKWKGQRYIDNTTFDQYLAYNNNNASGWREIATMHDVNSLKTQTKTVNGQSIWGSGDIEGGGSGGGGTTFINVIDNGAVGDGVTDDTVAIQTALEKSRTQGKALYFPNGTYLTRKSLVLTSNMRVTGEPGAILKSASATLEGGGKCIFTRLTAQALAGATSISVTSTTGFVVGQEIVIWSSGSYTETMADITAINGNTISIDTSRFTADGTNGGILNTVANNGYVLTDFAMVKTIMSKPAENVVVENITIMPMSDITEPHIYTSSPISQTKQQSSVAQKNFRVYNVTVYDSANDGISLQGSGESEVVGCRVYNQKHKGIHWGTTHDMIRIHGNYVKGCGSATYDNPNDYYGSGGMFFCVNNSRVIITNNHIENCYRGIYGLNDGDAQDRDAVIANNTFTNCGLYGIYMHGGNRVVVNANIFRNFAHGSIPICAEKGDTYNQIATVISNNVISDFNANFDGPAAIKVDGAKHMSITGNLISKQSTSGTQGIIEKGTNTNLVVARGDGIIITGNMVDGNIDISAETNVNVVAANNIYNATT